MFRVPLVLLVIFLVWCGLSPNQAHAQTQSDLRQAFVRVQEALVLGDLKRFVQSLKKLEIVYLSIQNKLPPEEKDQFQLWIYRFQFKRYQLQGALPNIREVGSFESAQAVKDYIQQFQTAMLALQKSLLFLRRYNKLYNLLSLKQDTNAQINLQASLSLERDLDTLIRQSQIYVALLKFALSHWSDRAKVTDRAKQQDADIELLRRQLQRATVERKAIKSNQQQLAKRVIAADKKFLTIQQAINGQQTAGIILVVGGSLFLAGGLAITTLGILANPSIMGPSPVFLPKENEDPTVPGRLNSQRAPDQSSLSYGLIGGGGGGVLLGTVLIIVGALQLPPPKKRGAAVLKSQGQFLKEPSPTQSRLQLSGHQLGSRQHRPTFFGIYAN
ncbi:MAG: hypothetical protein H6728_14060 [Myxococcales bacterium]|nr:hypothetical protein [Myxococcales bacterium]MCB9644196.1 hypothetical protein [Myxococcales bacterium]